MARVYEDSERSFFFSKYGYARRRSFDLSTYYEIFVNNDSLPNIVNAIEMFLTHF